MKHERVPKWGVLQPGSMTLCEVRDGKALPLGRIDVGNGRVLVFKVRSICGRPSIRIRAWAVSDKGTLRADGRGVRFRADEIGQVSVQAHSEQRARIKVQNGSVPFDSQYLVRVRRAVETAVCAIRWRNPSDV